MGPKRAAGSDLTLATKQPKTGHDMGAGASPLTPQHGGQHGQQHEHEHALHVHAHVHAHARAGLAGDFSAPVKRRLASSSRTGMACDRCKVRKIRCDTKPDGCSPCAQNRTPCTTTNRNTGRATTRGHAEALEAENSYLRAHIAELQAQVREVGAVPRVPRSFDAYSPAAGAPWPDDASWSETAARPSSKSPLHPYSGPASGAAEHAHAHAHADADADTYRPLPHFNIGFVGENYLGVSSGDSPLSHIQGTSLSIFGNEINITEFMLSDAEYDKSVMSYNSVLKVVTGDGGVCDYVPFPKPSEMREYAAWYFSSLNPYAMLLDKRTFMELIRRLCDEPTFQPSPSETVCVHMMIAAIKYQISARNADVPTMNPDAHQHYRYALSFFKHLVQRRKWQDIQALALFCHHMRNFPKPGAAWLMCLITFGLACELGFHRSTKAWADSGEMKPLEVEMRKRIFWTLHALSTNLAGMLGRPLPISVDDMDVEFPEPINDCLPDEEDSAMSPFRKCSFQVGIQLAKYTTSLATMFRTIYAVRQTPRGYDDAMRRLESGIRQWRKEIPSELADPQHASQMDYIYALYLEFWGLEFDLLLHHPALCRSTDPERVSANLDKCLDVSERMLQNCNKMRSTRSLDIPWINTVVYIAAIFTTIFIYFQRRDQLTMADMTKLTDSMNDWIDVMGECGALLGTGDKLRDAVKNIVDHSLKRINESVVKRTATESLARAALQTPQQQLSQAEYGSGNTYEQYHEPHATSTDAVIDDMGATYASAPTSAQFPYNHNVGSSSISTHRQASATFDQHQYGTIEDTGMTTGHAAALAAASNAQRPNGSYMYANPQTVNAGFHAQYIGIGAPSIEWQNWTRANMQQVGPAGEYLNSVNSATTLLALGSGRDVSTQGPGQDAAGAAEGSAVQGAGLLNYHWPHSLFNNTGPPEHGHQ